MSVGGGLTEREEEGKQGKEKRRGKKIYRLIFIFTTL